MRITLSIVFMAVAIFSQAQLFLFDRLVTVERIDIAGKKSTENSEVQRLVNSRNAAYYLEIKSDTLVRMREPNQNRFHDFKILNYSNEGDLELLYARTCDETELMKKRENELKSDRKVFLKTAENQFEYNSYKKKNSKSPHWQVKYKMEESETDQLQILTKLSDDVLLHFKENLDSTKNYTMTEISYWVDGKMNHNYRLKSVQTIKLKIILPKFLKFECLYPFIGFRN